MKPDITIFIKDYLGTFAENKDIAQKIRREQIIPAITKGQDVIIDFHGVTGATQSFVHALISDVIRQHSSNVLDKLFFKNCNNSIKEIISIVVDYMQQID